MRQDFQDLQSREKLDALQSLCEKDSQQECNQPFDAICVIRSAWTVTQLRVPDAFSENSMFQFFR